MRPKGGVRKRELNSVSLGLLTTALRHLSKAAILWLTGWLRTACASASLTGLLHLPRSPASWNLNDASLVLGVPIDSVSPTGLLSQRCEDSRFSAKLPAHFWSSAYAARDALTMTKPSFPFGTDSVFPSLHPTSS